jgi:hypothetical protein
MLMEVKITMSEENKTDEPKKEKKKTRLFSDPYAKAE